MLALPRAFAATPYRSLAVTAAFLATLAAFAVLAIVAAPLDRSGTHLDDAAYEVLLPSGLTQELEGPAPAAATPAPPVDLSSAAVGGLQTLSVPDIVPAQIPPPGEIAFKAADFTGQGIQASSVPRSERRTYAGPVSPPLPPPSSWPGRPFNTEDYDHIAENGFLAARSSPLSTFAIDVDRASYANVRRFIESGQRPPVDAVRIEELVNYFTYDYAGPTGRTPFAVHAEVAAAPWARSHRLVRIGIQGRRIATEKLPPSNLVFLIDVSGSMGVPNKLPLVKKSLRMLVDQMRERDRVAVVVYAGAAGLVLPSTSGADKRTILRAIDRLEAGGSTAGGAGLSLAYAVARENRVEGGNNRVILATDGDFNVGPSSDAEMIRLIEEKRAEGTFLTVLGFGTGNLKDAKMEQIADHGNGNFAYIDDELEAKKVLVQEMGGTLFTIAKDVKVQVEFNPARVAGYRLIGYENRTMAAQDFADDKKDGGELGAGHTVTALYEVVPVGAEESVELHGVDPLRYQKPDEPAASHGDELLLVKLRYKEPEGEESRLITRPVLDATAPASTDLRFAASVAAFGMVLRDSPYRNGFDMADVLRLARGGMGEDLEGYRAEFVRMVREAQSIEPDETY